MALQGAIKSKMPMREVYRVMMVSQDMGLERNHLEEKKWQHHQQSERDVLVPFKLMLSMLTADIVVDVSAVEKDCF